MCMQRLRVQTGVLQKFVWGTCNSGVGWGAGLPTEHLQTSFLVRTCGLGRFVHTQRHPLLCPCIPPSLNAKHIAPLTLSSLFNTRASTKHHTHLSFGSLCTHTTASTALLSSICIAMLVTMPVHCAPGTGGVLVPYRTSSTTPKRNSVPSSVRLHDRQTTARQSEETVRLGTNPVRS